MINWAAVRTALSVTIANIAGAFVAVMFPVNSLVAATVEGAGVAVAALVSFSLASKRPPHPEREIA